MPPLLHLKLFLMYYDFYVAQYDKALPCKLNGASPQDGSRLYPQTAVGTKTEWRKVCEAPAEAFK